MEKHMVHQHRGIFTIEISKNVSATRSQGRKRKFEDKSRYGRRENKQKRIKQKTLKTAGYSNVASDKNKAKTVASKQIRGVRCFWSEKGALKDRGTRVRLVQRVEEVLGRHTLHVGWPIGAEGLRGSSVALAAALYLVQDYTS